MSRPCMTCVRQCTSRDNSSSSSCPSYQASADKPLALVVAEAARAMTTPKPEPDDGEGDTPDIEPRVVTGTHSDAGLSYVVTAEMAAYFNNETPQ